MNRRTVIFHIENEKTIISEFSDTITILYLKIYIRDRTSIRNFDFYFNKELVTKNSTPLRRFCKDKNQRNINFQVKIKNDKERNNYFLKLKNSSNNQNINIFDNRNKYKNRTRMEFYEETINHAIEKKNELIKNINDCRLNINDCLMRENQNKEKFLNMEHLLIKQKEEIIMLRKEISDASSKYKVLKNKSVEKENRIKENQYRYKESNDFFEILKTECSGHKRHLSMESFNTSYIYKKKTYSINSFNFKGENKVRDTFLFRSSTGKDKDSIFLSNNNINNNLAPQLSISMNNISNISDKNNNEINIESNKENYNINIGNNRENNNSNEMNIGNDNKNNEMNKGNDNRNNEMNSGNDNNNNEIIVESNKENNNELYSDNNNENNNSELYSDKDNDNNSNNSEVYVENNRENNNEIYTENNQENNSEIKIEVNTENNEDNNTENNQENNNSQNDNGKNIDNENNDFNKENNTNNENNEVENENNKDNYYNEENNEDIKENNNNEFDAENNKNNYNNKEIDIENSKENDINENNNNNSKESNEVVMNMINIKSRTDENKKIKKINESMEKKDKENLSSNNNKYKYEIKEFNDNNNIISTINNSSIKKNNSIIKDNTFNVSDFDNINYSIESLNRKSQNIRDIIDIPTLNKENYKDKNKDKDFIDFNLIMKDFDEYNNKKITNYNDENSENNINVIKKLISQDNISLNKDSLIRLPSIYDIYFSVFKYLENSEILHFSITNKSYGLYVLYYWMNYLDNKISFLDENYQKLSEKYNSLNENLYYVESKSNIILSSFSKSGLKVLNSSHYLDIYNNPPEFFTRDNINLFIYKMLFQFNNLYDVGDDDEHNNNGFVSDNDFILFMQKEVKEKTNNNSYYNGNINYNTDDDDTKRSLKDYVYNLIDKEMNFNFENVLKAKKIMNQYHITDNIEGRQLTKTDRATTILGYVIRDIMGFTGLIVKDALTDINNSKSNIVEDCSYSKLKNNIINTCEKMCKEKRRCENINKKIKEIIIKYYHI